MNKNLQQALTVDTPRPFRILDWLIEPDTGRLIKDGQSNKLEPKVMGLLVYLAQRPGRVLAREELERAIWTGTVVGYDALTNAIIKLRKAFGDDPHRPWLIETVSKKGYRLIAPVTELDGALPSPAPKPRPVFRKRHRFGTAAWAVMAMAGLMIGWLVFDYLGARTARIPSIAVLPFANLGEDPKLEYFSDGVREDIITDLSKLSSLRVIAGSPSIIASGQPPTPKRTAEALGVRYVLEGSVRRSGDDIRITAKLIDTVTGSHLWAEGYNRRLQDIFAVQVDVTRNIVSALALTLTEEEKEYVARRDTRSVEAYDLFLQGQARHARNLPEENLSARELFLRALALDGNFTRAHGALALTHVDDFRYAWSNDPSTSADAALYHAERAVALDARSPQAHWILGFVQLHVRQDHATAVKMGERATALDPSHADGHALLAVAHLYRGDPETAVRHIERAMRLSPVPASRHLSVLGFAQYFSGRYDKARAVLEQALERDPVRLLPQLYLAATWSRLGNPDEARWLADIIRTQYPEYKLQAWADTQPFVDRAQLQKITDDLRHAGLN